MISSILTVTRGSMYQKLYGRPNEAACIGASADGITEFAGLEIAGLEFDGQHCRVENAGLENDGLQILTLYGPWLLHVHKEVTAVKDDSE